MASFPGAVFDYFLRFPVNILLRDCILGDNQVINRTHSVITYYRIIYGNRILHFVIKRQCYNDDYVHENAIYLIFICHVKLNIKVSY